MIKEKVSKLERKKAPKIVDAVDFHLQLKQAEKFVLRNGAEVYAVNAGAEEVLSLEWVFFAGNWQEDKNYHAFVMSDGDNMQWTFGGFLSNTDYWKSPYNPEIPMSFTSCVLNLQQAGSDVYNYLVKSQPQGTSVVEYCGGYYYPDLFATSRPDPENCSGNMPP